MRESAGWELKCQRIRRSRRKMLGRLRRRGVKPVAEPAEVKVSPQILPVAAKESATEEMPADTVTAAAPEPVSAVVVPEPETMRACSGDDSAGEEASAGDSMDALGELSGAVHDDLERAADLLERFGQCVSASACGVSGGRWVGDAGAAVSAVVLEGDQCAVSRDGGVGVSLLLHVVVCDQRDFVCDVSVDLGRVATAGAGAAIVRGCDPGDAGGSSSAQRLCRRRRSTTARRGSLTLR